VACTRTAPAGLAALAAALLGCAELPPGAELTVPGPGVGQPRLRVESLREARFRKTVRQQYDFSCGAAAVATLLTHHYGRATAEQEVFRAMWERGDREQIRRVGFSLLDMKRALAELGYAADGFRISLDDLARSGLPAIALLELDGFRHFVVIQGLSESAVLMADPAQGARVLERPRFEELRYDVLLVIRSPALAGESARLLRDWQLRPRAPLGLAGQREGLGGFTLMLPRGNEF
jgi:predicted double-glycine peptidase